MCLSYNLWQHRNNSAHSKTNHRQQRARDKLDETLLIEYDLGDNNMPKHAYHLFKIPREALLEMTVSFKCAWLHSIEAARKYSVLVNNVDPDTLDMYSSNRNYLRQWMSTKQF